MTSRDNTVECPECQGFGVLAVQVASPTWYDDGVDTRMCRRCVGTGKVDARHDTEPCGPPDVRDTWPAPAPSESEVA